MRFLKSQRFIVLFLFGIIFLVSTLWIIKTSSSADSLKNSYLPLPESTDSTIITLERSVCYGSCPDYKLTVSSDGSVVFEGHKFVKEMKTVKSTISQEKIKQLIDEFEKADYFSLKDKYQTEEDGCPEVWTDNPTAITSIKLNGKSKSITHYLGCQENHGNSVYPKGLTELENKIDEIVGTKQWIK